MSDWGAGALFDNAPDLHNPTVVLDTNIVLDAFVFDDPATHTLQAALLAGSLRWVASPAMRDELARVLAYPKLMLRLASRRRSAAQVLTRFDGLAQRVDAAARASLTCSDPDDQKFIDLAVAHQTMLLSRDRAVLCMAKRLLTLGVSAQSAVGTSANQPRQGAAGQNTDIRRFTA